MGGVGRKLATVVATIAAVAGMTGVASARDVDWTNRSLPEGVTTRTIAVGALQTRVYEAGPTDSREAVVFIHGNPGSSDDWPHLVSVAGAYGRAVALDMVGFGEASKPDSFTYTPGGEAAFLEQALTALGIDRVHLVLHDFGGPMGLEWARAHPDKLASVVLIDTGVFENYFGHPLAFVWHTDGLGEAAMNGLTRDSFGLAMQALSLRPLPPAFIDTAWSHYDTATRAAWLKMYRSYETPLSPDEMGRAEAAALRPHKIPALVIWGDTDSAVPVYLAYEQQDAFPGAQVEILHAGHWPFVELVDDVDALVRPFWKQHVQVLTQ